jgi:hypothetical protein
MSNPGVIYLASKNLSNGKIFRVEDNIGEAIHFHYDNEIRMDLTVDEFLKFAEKCTESLENLLDVDGFELRNFDPIFLDMFSENIIDLVRVEHATINLEELKIQTVNRIGLPVIKGLNESRVYKAINGENKELVSYKQENNRDQDNLQRLNNLLEYTKNNNYPMNNEYIVLFNNQNIIRDGQHRAACMYHLYGNKNIPIIRLHFKDNLHNTSNYPWIDYLLKWDKRRVKKLLKKFIRNNFLIIVKKIIKRIKIIF